MAVLKKNSFKMIHSSYKSLKGGDDCACGGSCGCGGGGNK